jgi:hypothetical protein
VHAGFAALHAAEQLSECERSSSSVRLRAAFSASAQRARRRSARRRSAARISDSYSAASLTSVSRLYLEIGSYDSIATVNVDALARWHCWWLGHSLQTKLRVRVQLARSARRGAPQLL